MHPGNKNPIYQEYLQVKGEWEKLIKKKPDGIILRSKTKWSEEGEKNTKYFLNLEKRNYNKKTIKKLIGANGDEITDPKKISKNNVDTMQIYIVQN